MRSAKIAMFDALMSNAMKKLKLAMILSVACASNADAFNSVYLRGKGLGGEMFCSDWNRARGNETAVLMSWVFGFITGYDAAIRPDPSDGSLDGQAIENLVVSLCKEHPDGDLITVAKSIAGHLEREVTGEVNPPIILKKSAPATDESTLSNGKNINIPIARGGISLPGVSGNQILARCTQKSDKDYCLAWMQLAADNGRSLKGIAPELGACLPQDVDAAQLRDVAVDYLRKHPKDRHMAAAPLVAEAFEEVWPCKQ